MITQRHFQFWGITLFFFCLAASRAQAQTPLNLTLFFDEDSLTVFVVGDQVVSLQGIGLQYSVNGQVFTRWLESYPAFGIPFDGIPTPICFRLMRDQITRVLPQACNGLSVPTQPLSNADVFWYDATLGSSRTLLIVQGGNPIGVCAAGQPVCSITLAQPTDTPMPTLPPTDTPMPTWTPTLVPPTPMVYLPGAPQYISYNSPIYGTLEPLLSGSGLDYIVTAFAGDVLTIRLRFEGSYAPRLVLLSSAGEELAYSDFYVVQENGVSWRDAVIPDFTIPVSGDYTIRVQEWSQITFSFLLRVDLGVMLTMEGTDVLANVPIMTDGRPEILPLPTP